MTEETNSRATPSPPPAADVLSHLKAFIRSIPDPVFPPEADYSQVLDILRATRPLLDGDGDWILPGVALLEGQLPMYDTLIDQLQATLGELQVYRDTIQSISEEFSSTLAPIRRLPSKVLRSVFLRSVFQNIQSDIDEWWSRHCVGPSIQFLHDTMTLSHVCASWRDIVVSSPELWSYIKVIFPTFRSSDRSLPLDTILHLSGQLPLDIQYISGGDSSSGGAIEAFSSLLRERHRWRSVSLQIPVDLLEQLRTSSGKLGYLESLALMTPLPLLLHKRTSSPENISDFFIDAPSLRRVILHEVIEGNSFSFPCQITHLAASFSTIHNLHSYSLLEELHLEDGRNDDFAFPHRITLPKVRRLSVSSQEVLRRLHLPSLEDLSFDSYSIGGHLSAHLYAQTIADATVTIRDFIRSSHCSLTSLATPNPIVYASSFVQETFPLLESLTSLAFEIDNTFECRFYDTLRSPNVLPNLRYLMMRLPPLEMKDISQDALSAMLASRGQHLSVTIECPIMPDEKHVGILNRLEPLRQLGVDLRTVANRDPPAIGIQFGNFA
ncbi:hypothetical protein EDD18DRAFT_1355292 [Armillaria luteobubalina]|uniref:F-box domain-containing protein n=1 Tax=Armillaria luteobubalina TaxID=153913 RepID=A0AA39Q1K8_9AGAR|nr:hypothetical protein EDD18DRAFT_1355292 [Armillaria luteobubalina]